MDFSLSLLFVYCTELVRALENPWFPPINTDMIITNVFNNKSISMRDLAVIDAGSLWTDPTNRSDLTQIWQFMNKTGDDQYALRQPYATGGTPYVCMDPKGSGQEVQIRDRCDNGKYKIRLTVMQDDMVSLTYSTHSGEAVVGVQPVTDIVDAEFSAVGGILNSTLFLWRFTNVNATQEPPPVPTTTTPPPCSDAQLLTEIDVRIHYRHPYKSEFRSFRNTAGIGPVISIIDTPPAPFGQPTVGCLGLCHKEDDCRSMTVHTNNTCVLHPYIKGTYCKAVIESNEEAIYYSMI